MLEQLLRDTKLKDVMAHPVITVHEEDEFHKVQDKFETYDIRHLPVINDAGRVVGLISQRHLYKIHSPRHLESGEWHYDRDMLDSFILKHVMVKDPHVLSAENTIEDAMRDMVQFKFGCIPIVDQFGRPIGVVTRDSIIRFFLKP